MFSPVAVAGFHPSLLRVGLVAALAVLALLVLTTAAVGYSRLLQTRTLETDYALFAELGRIQASGGVLYRDLWDNKPPGMFFYLSAFIALLGNTPSAIYIATLVANLLFVAAITGLAYQLTQSRVAALFAALLGLPYSAAQEGPETTFLMATVGASAYGIALAARGRSLWLLIAGLVFSLGVLVKQPLLMELPALVVVALWRTPATRQARLRAVVMVSAGIGLAIAAVAAWVIHQGTAEAFWNHVFAYNARYVFSSTGEWHGRDEAEELFQHYFVGGTLPYLRPLLILAALSALFCLRDRQRRSAFLILAFWLLIAFSSASVARAFRRDYYAQVLPPLIALAVLGVPIIWRLHGAARIGFSVAALLVALNFSDQQIHVFSEWSGSEHVDVEDVVRVVLDQTEPGDCLWLWGYLNNVSFLSERPSCTAVPYDGHAMDETAFHITPNRIEFLRDLLEKPPALHVREDTWGYFPELAIYAERYLRQRIYVSTRYEVFAVDTSAYHPTKANFGHEIALIGYDLAPQDSYCAGDVLRLSLTWQRLSTPRHQYQMFAQVLTAGETARVAGYDGPPSEERATNTWVDEDEVVLGPTFELGLPGEMEAGEYALVVGLYELETLVRVDVVDEAGNAVGTYARLQTINVRACNAL